MRGLGKCFDKRPVVYRFYDAADNLLYVGCTTRLPQRMASHLRAAPWSSEVNRVTWQLMPDLQYALFAEQKAILFEAPRYNRSGQLSDDIRSNPSQMDALRRMFEIPRRWAS